MNTRSLSKRRVLLAVIAAWSISSSAQAEESDDQPSDPLTDQIIKASRANQAQEEQIAPKFSDLLSAGSETPKVDVPPLRQTLLRESAFEAGVRYGRAARSGAWKQLFESRQMDFDRIYRFGRLMQSGGEMPPVIEVLRGKDATLATRVEDKKMVLAAETYNIIEPSRFVSTPPSWRSYVYQGLTATVSSSDMPDKVLRPANAEEKRIWDTAVRDGWIAGGKIADQTVKTNLARLNRDFFGQLSYIELVARGMMEPATVGADRSVVVGSRQRMSVDQTTINLDREAGLVPDASKWTNKK